MNKLVAINPIKPGYYTVEGKHEIYLAKDVEAALAAKDAEIERCKRAIDWCLENGATRAFWPQPHERFLIGSDLERLAVPAEFADIISPAAGGHGK